MNTISAMDLVKSPEKYFVRSSAREITEWTLDGWIVFPVGIGTEELMITDKASAQSSFYLKISDDNACLERAGGTWIKIGTFICREGS